LRKIIFKNSVCLFQRCSTITPSNAFNNAKYKIKKILEAVVAEKPINDFGDSRYLSVYPYDNCKNKSDLNDLNI
jgi:hypothetical protein